MKYQEVYKGIFQKRPNRFIAEVELEGRREICHVKNTGRCRELLVPGAVVYLEKSQNPARKTGYSLIAVEKGELLINMDSQAPNRAAGEWLAQGGMGFLPKELRPEYTWGLSIRLLLRRWRKPPFDRGQRRHVGGARHCAVP